MNPVVDECEDEQMLQTQHGPMWCLTQPVIKWANDREIKIEELLHKFREGGYLYHDEIPKLMGYLSKMMKLVINDEKKYQRGYAMGNAAVWAKILTQIALSLREGGDGYAIWHNDQSVIDEAVKHWDNEEMHNHLKTFKSVKYKDPTKEGYETVVPPNAARKNHFASYLSNGNSSSRKVDVNALGNEKEYAKKVDAFRRLFEEAGNPKEVDERIWKGLPPIGKLLKKSGSARQKAADAVCARMEDPNRIELKKEAHNRGMSTMRPLKPHKSFRPGSTLSKGVRSSTGRLSIGATERKTLPTPVVSEEGEIDVDEEGRVIDKKKDFNSTYQSASTLTAPISADYAVDYEDEQMGPYSIAEAPSDTEEDLLIDKEKELEKNAHKLSAREKEKLFQSIEARKMRDGGKTITPAQVKLIDWMRSRDLDSLTDPGDGEIKLKRKREETVEQRCARVKKEAEKRRAKEAREAHTKARRELAEAVEEQKKAEKKERAEKKQKEEQEKQERKQERMKKQVQMCNDKLNAAYKKTLMRATTPTAPSAKKAKPDHDLEMRYAWVASHDDILNATAKVNLPLEEAFRHVQFLRRKMFKTGEDMDEDLKQAWEEEE